MTARIIMENFSNFLKYATEKASKNGLHIHLIADEKVEGCSGYYLYPNLYVATKRENWEPIFIHEFSHFLQDLDEKAEKYPGYGSITLNEYATWTKWTTQPPKNVSKQKRNKIIEIRKKIQAMEHNCDRRAIQLIKKFNIELDTEKYIQTANTYHLFYTYLSDIIAGGWYKTQPYIIKELNDLMPSTWLKEWDTTKHPEWTKIVTERCF